MMKKEYQTVEEIREEGALTGKEMCKIIYYFHRCVDFRPHLTPKQIWEVSPTGELYPVINEFQMALLYFETKHNGKIIKHQFPKFVDVRK